MPPSRPNHRRQNAQAEEALGEQHAIDADQIETHSEQQLRHVLMIDPWIIDCRVGMRRRTGHLPGCEPVLSITNMPPQIGVGDVQRQRKGACQHEEGDQPEFEPSVLPASFGDELRRSVDFSICVRHGLAFSAGRRSVRSRSVVSWVDCVVCGRSLKDSSLPAPRRYCAAHPARVSRSIVTAFLVRSAESSPWRRACALGGALHGEWAPQRQPPYLGRLSRLALPDPFGNFSTRSWERRTRANSSETNSDVRPPCVLARRSDLLSAGRKDAMACHNTNDLVAARAMSVQIARGAPDERPADMEGGLDERRSSATSPCSHSVDDPPRHD